MAFLVVFVLAAVFVYSRVSTQSSETLDDGLRGRISDLTALVDSSRGGTPRLVTGVVDPEDSFSQILTTRGRVVTSTRRRAAPALRRSEMEAARHRAILLSGRAVPGIDGTARVRARAVQGYIVVAATSEADREETLDGLLRAFAIGVPFALLLATGLGYVLAGRGLAPVETMRRRAERITLERSGERLPLAVADDEVRHLGETLNAMLDRLEASLERERVFVADASHELRTPLAILRTELELADRPDRSPEEVRAALRSAADEVDRLSRLAEDLLVIARTDQGRLPIAPGAVVVGELLDRVRARLAPAGRVLVVQSEAGLVAELDPLRMEQALGNLVDNAFRYGAGDVVLAARKEGEAVVFEVSDDGPGFASDFAPVAFERFTRAGGRANQGTGLGLAIARAIAAAHGGTIEIASGPGATVRITVPLSPSSHPAPPA